LYVLSVQSYRVMADGNAFAMSAVGIEM